MTDKNPPPYPIRKYVPRPPVPGSYKGLLRALSAAARELGMPMGAAAPPPLRVRTARGSDVGACRRV